MSFNSIIFIVPKYENEKIATSTTTTTTTMPQCVAEIQEVFDEGAKLKEQKHGAHI